MNTRNQIGIVSHLAARILAGSIAALLAAPSTGAATFYWDANAGTALQTDGAGVWLTANQWWDGTVNQTWVSGSDAVFGNGGAGGAVTLASATTVNSFTFNYFTGTYALGTLGSEITLGSGGITKNAGSGAVTLSNLSPIKLGAAQTWTNNSATLLTLGAVNLNGSALTFGGTGTFTFEGNTQNVLSGVGGIIKNGSGTLILDAGAPNPLHLFSGGIVVNGGAVRFQTAANVTGRGNVTLNGGYLGMRFGSSITFAGGLGTGATAIQILGGVSGFSGEGGTGSTATIGTGGSTLKWGATGENGATGFFNPSVLLLGGDQGMNTNAKGTLANAIDLNGATRTITSIHTNGDGAATTGFTVTGALTNTAGTAAGLIKTGPGAVILTAANTYNGDTSIQGGSIILSGNGTINSTTALGLSGGGTLRIVNGGSSVNRFADVAVTSNGGSILYDNGNTAAITYTETFGAVTLSGGNLDVVQLTNQNTSNGQTLTFGTGGSSNLTQSGTGTVTFSATSTGPQATGNKNMFVVFGSGTTSGWVNAATSNAIIGPWATTGTAAAAQTDYAVYSGGFVVPAATAADVESNWTSATTQYTAGLTGLAGTTLGATRTMAALKLNATTSALTSVTFAGAAATDFITVTGSNFANGDVVSFGGTAPGGLATGIPYYVVNSGTNGVGTFTVSATSGGAPIDLTSAGTSPNVVAGITLATGRNLGTTGILNSTAAGLTIGKGTGGVVTLPSAVSANLYVNTGNGAAIIVGAPIADNGAGLLTLVKTGTSTLRLIDVNTYTGNTAINAGTLQIGINGQALANGAKLGGAPGTYAGNIFIAAGAALNIQSDASQTLSGIISGDGTLTKINTGTLTLGNANTYTGKTSLSSLTTAGSGTLVVSSFNSVNGGTPLLAASSLGAPTTIANGTIDVGGGTQSGAVLQYAGPAATGEITDRVINFPFNASSTRTIDASGSGLLKFTSAPTSNGTTTSSVTLQGNGSGEFTQGLPFGFTNLTKSGTGTWTLGGFSGHTGTTTISGGTLAIIGSNVLGSTSGVSIGNTTAATLSLLGDSSTNFVRGGNGTPLSVTTTTATGVTINADRATVAGTASKTMTIGTLLLNTAVTNGTTFTGANNTSLSIGAVTTGASASGTETLTNNISGGGSLTLASVAVNRTTAPTLAFAGTGNTTVTGAITQVATTALTKSGLGTLTLAGTSSHSGATTISAGSLQIGSGGTTGRLAATTSITNNANLTINRSDAFTQASDLGAGVAITGSGSFTQAGAGTTTLTATNGYTGATNVNAGTLEVTGSLSGTTGVTVSTGGTLLLNSAANNIVNTAAPVAAAGGTLAFGNAANQTQSLGAFTLSVNSILDFGAGGADKFIFGGVGAHTFGSGITLTIQNWSSTLAGSTPGTGLDGIDDRLVFSGATSDFTSKFAQNEVFFGGGSGYAAIDFSGNGTAYEIVPVPEPSTTALLGAVALCAVIGYRERRRFSRKTGSNFAS